MIFEKYFLKRLFINIFSINIGLTLLFSLVEFFEKMVRFKPAASAAHGAVETIAIFIALNFVPLFFSNLALSTWLGSCMMIKEMSQQNEWEILPLINVKMKRIFSLVLIAGTILMLGNFFGKEVLTHRLEQSAENFRHEKFKQNSKQKLFNRWFAIDNTTFCHFNLLDLKTNKGSDFSMIELSPKFMIEKITAANVFSMSERTNEIILPSGNALQTRSKTQEIIKNKALHLPGFFSQLHTQSHTPELSKLFQVVIFDKNVLPPHVYHQLLYTFLNRILIYLLLLMYPLLTFALFFLFPYHRYLRWFLIFLPYPLATLLLTTADSLSGVFTHGIFAAAPYAVLIALTTVLYAYNPTTKSAVRK